MSEQASQLLAFLYVNLFQAETEYYENEDPVSSFFTLFSG